jgi:Tfp pilus assembly protein PilO
VKQVSTVSTWSLEKRFCLLMVVAAALVCLTYCLYITPMTMAHTHTLRTQLYSVKQLYSTKRVVFASYETLTVDC